MVAVTLVGTTASSGSAANRSRMARNLLVIHRLSVEEDCGAVFLLCPKVIPKVILRACQRLVEATIRKHPQTPANLTMEGRLSN
jgi:hypothetical protein